MCPSSLNKYLLSTHSCTRNGSSPELGKLAHGPATYVCTAHERKTIFTFLKDITHRKKINISYHVKIT